MIARVWHGVTSAADGDAYLAYLTETGVAEMQATPGNRGVYLLRRTDGDRCRFVFISLWDDLDAIRAFAGPDIERAVYYPTDHRYLLAMPPTVQHFEVHAFPEHA